MTKTGASPTRSRSRSSYDARRTADDKPVTANLVVNGLIA
jgi:hypothetical protein